jgi:hypothetical protein
VDIVAQGQGIAHPIAFGTDVNGAAAKPGKVIDGRLQCPLIAAANVALVDANPYFPEPDGRKCLLSDCGDRLIASSA